MVVVPNVVAATHSFKNSTTAAVDRTRIRLLRTALSRADSPGWPGLVVMRRTLVSAVARARRNVAKPNRSVHHGHGLGGHGHGLGGRAVSGTRPGGAVLSAARLPSASSRPQSPVH